MTNETVGYYKCLTLNKNKSIGVKWIAVDAAKKENICRTLSLLGWSSVHDSQLFYPCKIERFSNKSDAVKRCNEYKEIANRIDNSLFYGSYDIFVGTVWGMYYSVFNLYVKGIYKENVNALLEQITGLDVDGIEIEKLLPMTKEAQNISIFKTKGDDLGQIISSPHGRFIDNHWEFEDVEITSKPLVMDWEKSKLTKQNVAKLALLDGFKPRILDAAYEPKAGYSSLDAIESFSILNAQNINTDKIRAALYNQIFVPFFIVPILFLIYKFANINNRFFRPTEFASMWVFGTLFVWGGFFLLYRFSSNSVILPEFGLLGPLFTMFVLSFFAYKKSQKVKI